MTYTSLRDPQLPHRLLGADRTDNGPDGGLDLVQRPLSRHLHPPVAMQALDVRPDEVELRSHPRLRVQVLVPLLAVRSTLGRDLGRERQEEREIRKGESSVRIKAEVEGEALGVS